MSVRPGLTTGEKARQSMSHPGLSIIIPIYNEEELLPTVLAEVCEVDWEPKQLVLVDDGSSDGTWAILQKYAHREDTVIIQHETRQGKGAAIRSGLQRATGEIVIVQDADMEYIPAEIPSVVRPIAEGEVEICYGSRFLGRIEGMRFPNRVANHLLAWTVRVLFSASVTDEATCYKAFKREVIDAFELRCKRFEFCPEVTAKALKAGYRIKEVPVTYRARTFDEGKKIKWTDFIQAMQVLFRVRFLED